MARLISTIVQDVIESCAVQGLMVKHSPDSQETRYNHAPISLFPTPYPIDMYREAVRLQYALGDLVSGIITKPQTNIHRLLANFSAKDEFLARLVNVSKAFNEQRERG